MMRHLLLLMALLAAALAPTTLAKAEDIPVDCPKPAPKAPAVARADVYKDTPFKAGEISEFEGTYGGVSAGFATLEVRPPQRYNSSWQRVFHGDVKTNDWYRKIFVLHDEVQAISRPWDFGISQFYMTQNEGKFLSSPFVQEKWLEFDHDNCVTHERTKVPDKAEELANHPLFRGANDALGVAFNIRTRRFKLGQTERAPVYTSEKNWWLEAIPLTFEKIEVPAGTFDTVKLKLRTFIGKDLQQQGDVYAWIATTTPQRQLVQLEGEIKIGSLFLKLIKYTPGTP